MPLRILAVVGARPNFMKMAPLMAEMRRHRELAPTLVHTGQHFDYRMSQLFFEELGMPEPEHNLGVSGGSHATQTAQVMMALEPLMLELAPELVLVVGDVNSTLAAALVAAKLNIPVGHGEAGLRSFDRTMPEEVNRVLTDAVADHLFVTEDSGLENLAREGVPAERVHLVGNVMIDTLLAHRPRALALHVPEQMQLTPGEYAVVTLHRPATVDSPAALAGVVDALARIAEQLPIVFPVHPRTRQRLAEAGLDGRFAGRARLRLIDPLGYLDFLGLLAQARLVLTDSGGIQEETTVLGVPCLTLRHNTERPITVTHGTNVLAGTDPATILARAQDVLAAPPPKPSAPPLWDGHAAERIVAILERLAQPATAACA